MQLDWIVTRNKNKTWKWKEPESRCRLEADVGYQAFIAHEPEGEWTNVVPLRTLSVNIECADLVIQVGNMVISIRMTTEFVTFATRPSQTHRIWASIDWFIIQTKSSGTEISLNNNRHESNKKLFFLDVTSANDNSLNEFTCGSIWRNIIQEWISISQWDRPIQCGKLKMARSFLRKSSR